MDKQNVLAVLQEFIEDEDARPQLYREHTGLQPVFDFFGTRMADDFRLLLDGVEDLCVNQDLVIFELFRTNAGDTVCGSPHHRLLFKRFAGSQLLCESGQRGRVRVRPDTAIILVKPKPQLTRDIMEWVLDADFGL